MSWHCDGPCGAPRDGRLRALRPICCSESAYAAERALSSRDISMAANNRAARSESAAVAVESMPRRPSICRADFTIAPFAVSAYATPCEDTATRSLKMRGLLTIRACSGCASGTRITSMRNSALFGSVVSFPVLHPGSSVLERTGASPDT